MSISDSGIIHDFLTLLGIEITTQSGAELAFVVAGALLVASLALVLAFLFKLLVYIRRG